jgi:DNA-binding XRE family transcriptional regulator
MTDYVDTDEQDFASWLNQILDDNNISASDLARDIDVNRSTISLWRSGQRLPVCHLRVKLAEHLSNLEIDGFNAIVREILWRVHVSEWRAENHA